ncbi:hypothetical protein BD309DRAFT_726018 [Dichomitus squalens]|uniref:Uncharacterized protein n=1 Tax=Dichomitus squalens TaxID=114155 RepID=A0A4Q9PCD5_9APHY|nr:hypothetical protein BD309DRAFT_726018 [Dichomitus squalens]TBU63074.1 hypothetical protein BD310DRAFT_667163 [Dichomitus squalens]
MKRLHHICTVLASCRIFSRNGWPFSSTFSYSTAIALAVPTNCYDPPLTISIAHVLCSSHLLCWRMTHLRWLLRTVELGIR